MDKEGNQSTMVLIVDDVPKNIQVVASFLKQEGYQLAFAQSGKVAIEQARSKPVDLILLDVMMPDMDGFETCAKLKASPKTQHIPVIFLTGKADIESVVRGFDVGGVDYVTKPFNQREFLARVKNHLELKQAKKDVQNLYDLMDEELSIASDIQKNMMREKVNVSFLSSSMILKPFGKVSGDMVDFSSGGGREFNLFLGDATGHGIPAALITMMIPFILDENRESKNTIDIVTKINDTLSLRNMGEMFITGIYAKITADGHLSLCNAGHPPMMILPADGSPLISLKKKGLAMGMFSKKLPLPYVEEKYRLKPGDKFFLYTDGITEWQNSEKKQFGKDRLIACLEENRQADPESILRSLTRQIEHFSEGVPCKDDYTILAFEYLGEN